MIMLNLRFFIVPRRQVDSLMLPSFFPMHFAMGNRHKKNAPPFWDRSSKIKISMSANKQPGSSQD